MKCMRLFFSVVVCAFVNVAVGLAGDIALLEHAKFTPVDALQATWVFSGIVTSENGEDFGYYFQLQRDNSHFHTSVALMDQASKKVLFHEESDATLVDVAPYDWHVGRSFLKFNPINDSWIFGVKPDKNLGFNFKVDMLKQFATTPSVHQLRSGVSMMVSQTSELNGHILTGDSENEQFVTTKEAWFRQIWQKDEDNQSHSLTNVLCQFNDGSRFYSVNLNERDAQSGSLAGWYNAEGTRQAMSQFVQVSRNKSGLWHIQSYTPRFDLVLSDAIEQHSVIAGFVEGKKNRGFCMLNKDRSSDSWHPTSVAQSNESARKIA